MRHLAIVALLAACASPGGDDTTDPADDTGVPEVPAADEPTEQVTFPDADPTGPDPGHLAKMPACASRLAQAMFDGTADVIWRGTLPGDHFATMHSTADTDALIDGPQIFPAFRALIATARHDVSLQTYVWENGSDPANEILAGLSDLAARRIAEHSTEPPVMVRFVLDTSTINFGSNIVTLPRLWAAVQALQLDPAHVRFELAAMYHVGFGTLHVKTLVIDGRDAIVTGANPQAHHNYDAPWRDAGFRFTGDVAVSMLADFDSAWRKAALWTCGSDESTAWDQCSGKTTRPTWIVRRPALPASTCRPMMVTTRQIDMNPTSNRIDNTQAQAFLAGWGAAQRHIRIQTPNLNDDAAKSAVIAAVKRGVQVDVILSKGFNDIAEDLPGQGGDNAMNVRDLYQALTDAGVANPCEHLRIRWYSRDGVRAIQDNGAYASHAKYSSIDDEVVIVGTANMDTQSWNNSRELNVVVDDPALTQAWDAQLFVSEFAQAIPVQQCPSASP